ncbi:MAG TPA: VOC family protein [Acidimicrobiales bacterium]|nr:VOC family protein [Acidimicrobiales bacterium]
MSPLVLPGPVRQNDYVVRNLDAAIAEWLALGVGPWITLGPLEQAMWFRGETHQVTITLAFASSGDLQLELIHQTGDAPSAYREFLDAGREGFHHLAWWVDDIEAVQAEVEAAGHPVAFSGDGGGAARFFYVDAPSTVASFLEVMELNDMTRGLAEHVEAAAAGWDGSTDPVRKLF